MPLDFPTNPVDGQVYDGFIWVDALDAWRRLPVDPSIPLGLLEDVTLTSPTIDEVLKYDGTQWVNGTDEGGKILQVVRATDSSDRTTTSTSFVDASISVTITPKISTSAIIVLWAFSANPDVSQRMVARLTDNSNNALSGAESHAIGKGATGGQLYPVVIIGYATPNTTSATTYKGRFATVSSGTATIANTGATGQLYAIEVSA